MIPGCPCFARAEIMAGLLGCTVVVLPQVYAVFSPGLQQQTDGSSELTGFHVPLFVNML